MKSWFVLAFTCFVVVFTFGGPFVADQSAWVSDIVNSPVPYALAPFCAGLMGRRLGMSAFWGIAITTMMVALFYIGDDLASEGGINRSGLTAYLSQAIVGGGILGSLGWLVGHARKPAHRLLGCLVFCGAVLGYQVLDIAVPDNSSAWDDVSLLLSAVLWCCWPIAALIWHPVGPSE